MIARLGQGIVARLDPLTRSWPLPDDRRWLLPLLIVGYVLAMTWKWKFPDWQGIPFPPIFVASIVLPALAWRRWRGVLEPYAAAAIAATASMAMTDVAQLWTQPIRDIELYLKAGDRWLAGAPIYSQVPLTANPTDLSNYPFLYPPVTLPLFGVLGLLPMPVAAALWIGASALLFVGALRLVGLSWRWCVFLLAWPPVFQGLYVGNVAVPLFALFAAAPWRPGLLAVAPIFKLYSGIAGLWLLRTEHRLSFLLGVVAVLGVCVLTLPMTGLTLWGEWLRALGTYQVSQQQLPDYLYGFGLARYVPMATFAVVAGVVTVLALRARGRREQLARLGVATVAGSPSLFSHGWLVALPALFALDTPWLWLALGLTSCAPGAAWFAAIGLVLAGWFDPILRKQRGFDAWHPLGVASSPWPGAIGRFGHRRSRRQDPQAPLRQLQPEPALSTPVEPVVPPRTPEPSA